MKKNTLAIALLLAGNTAQSATLEPNAIYDMNILADGITCFTFGDCSTAAPGSVSLLVDNDNDAAAAAGSANPDFGSAIAGDGLAGVVNITTTSDGAGGVTFTVNSFNMDTYNGTAGGQFATMAADTSGMSGSVDVDGNITFDPTGRTGMAQFFNTSLGEQPWNTGSTFTSGNQVNAVANLTGSALIATTDIPPLLTATIVSATAVGPAWGFFVDTPYTEVFSLEFDISLIARDDSLDIDQATTNNTLSVLANDSSGSGSGLTIASIDTSSTQGTVNGFVGGDTTLSYTPPADLTLTTDTIGYTMTDGVDSLSATVSITIIDTTPPNIVLNLSNPLNISNGNTYNEPGANCTDNFDADKPAVVAGDTVNTSVDATYVVTYNCTDTAGNAAVEVTRDVVVSTADLPPVISVNGADPLDVTVTSGNSNSFTQAIANSDVSCTDDVDTPILTNNALVQVDTSTLGGPFTITYDCTDSVPQAATPVTRVINVVDNIDPVVVPTGSDPTNIVVGNSYVEQGANCTDNYDISPTLVITPAANTVDTSVIGNTTTITYTCTDASGNTDIATIDVVTISTGPVITVTGDNPVSLFLGQAYTEEGAVCTDDVDADQAATVSGDTVNSNVEGTYTVRYNCTDSDGNDATEVTRTVNIGLDTEAPTISLNGAAVINLNKGFTYFEQGAVCSDNADDDKDATVGGDIVDPSTAGNYTVSYSCSDSAGNAASIVTRTVTINEVSSAATSTADPNDDEIGSIGWFMLASFIGLMIARRKPGLK